MRPADILFPRFAALKAAGLCPFCEQPIGEFRDAISEKEYTISGLCQSCQDEVFS